MKLGAERGKSAAHDLDLRVRDRHLGSGALDPKAVERYLTELPDLEAHAESIAVDQPALGGSGTGPA